METCIKCKSDGMYWDNETTDSIGQSISGEGYWKCYVCSNRIYEPYPEDKPFVHENPGRPKKEKANV